MNVLDRRVLEALAAGEEPDARTHRPLDSKVLALVFHHLRDEGFVQFDRDAYGITRVSVTDKGRRFLDGAHG